MRVPFADVELVAAHDDTEIVHRVLACTLLLVLNRV
jgi:hypothetical protein